MEVQAVLVDDNPDNFRGMLAALDGVKAIRFEGETITSKFHSITPLSLPDGNLNLKAMAARIRHLNPAVAIVDMRLKGDVDFSGVDLSQRIKRVCPNCSIILVSTYFESAPELIRYLEVFRHWLDRNQPAELFEKDVQKRYTEALKTHVGNIKYRKLVGTTHPLPSPGLHSRNPVYISYAGDDGPKLATSREEIVNRLDDSLQAAGYDVRRDKRNLAHKGSIKKFMKELGRAACVVTVISDKYLRSRYCMTELLELRRNRHFQKRIFPVVLPDADIAKLPARLKYVSYWQNEFKQLEKAIRTLPSQAGFDEWRIYKEIRENVDTLLAFLADMKHWTPPLVEANNFAELKQSIDQRLRELDA